MLRVVKHAGKAVVEFKKKHLIITGLAIIGNAFSTVKEKVSGKLAGTGAEAVNSFLLKLLKIIRIFR